MAMSRYTSNSNTCISQNIPEYQNAGFRGKNENTLVDFLTIHDRDIFKLNNSASNMKQLKILKLNQPDYKNSCLDFRFIKTPILTQKSRL